MSAATGNSSSSYTGEKTNQDKKYAVLGYRTERAYGPLSNNKVPVRRARNTEYGPLSNNKVPVRRARNADYGPLSDNKVPVRRARNADYGPLSNNKVPVRRARNADYGPLSDNKVPVRRARNTDYGPLCDNEVPVRRAWKTHYVSLRAALRTEADQKQKRRPMQAWGVTFSLLIPGLVHPRGGCCRCRRCGLFLGCHN